MIRVLASSQTALLYNLQETVCAVRYFDSCKQFVSSVRDPTRAFDFQCYYLLAALYMPQ
jgi:hypothetical protein